jgi:hypothetical protein
MVFTAVGEPDDGADQDPGGDGDPGGDLGGDPGALAQEVIFDDSEGEVITADPQNPVETIEFTEDDVSDDVIMPDPQDMQRLAVAKAQLAQLATEGNTQAFVCTLVGVAGKNLGVPPTPLVPALGSPTIWAYCLFTSALNKYLAEMAKEAAADPPEINSTVVKFTPPASVLPQIEEAGEPLQTFARCLANISRALAASTTSIERYQGARSANLPSDIVRQADAIAHNADACVSALQELWAAAGGLAPLWTNLMSQAEQQLGATTPVEIAQTLELAWQTVKPQFEASFNLPQSGFATADSGMISMIAEIRSGSVNSATVLSSPFPGTAWSAIVKDMPSSFGPIGQQFQAAVQQAVARAQARIAAAGGR